MDYSIPSKVQGYASILHLFTKLPFNFVECMEGEEDEVVWGVVVEECHEGGGRALRWCIMCGWTMCLGGSMHRCCGVVVL